MFLIDIDCPEMDCCIPHCPYLLHGRETEIWCDDHCRSLYDDTEISYKYFFIGRIYQIILSGIITYIICLLVY